MAKIEIPQQAEASAGQYPWAAAVVKEIKQILPAFSINEFFDEGYELRGPKVEDGEKLAVKLAKALKKAGYSVVKGNSGGDGDTYAVKIEGGHMVVIEPTAEVFEDGAYLVSPYVRESDLDWESKPKALAGATSGIQLHDFVTTAAEKKSKNVGRTKDDDAKFKDLFAKLSACDKERDALEAAFERDVAKLFKTFEGNMDKLISKGIKIGEEIDELATATGSDLLESQEEQVHNWMMDGTKGPTEARYFIPKALLNPTRTGKRR